jgi:enoyl-CoA hydratase
MNLVNCAGAPTLVVEGPTAWITLNRPGTHNRFEGEDIASLDLLFDQVEGMSSVRVLILTATGPTFSAGFNILALGDQQQASTVLAFGRLCDRLETLMIPTVCALNGSVYGGATDFALACDYRVGVRTAQMMMPPTRLGIQYFYGGLSRYVDQLGLSTAKRLLLSAETIDADTMLRIGFLHQLVDLPDLRGRATSVAASIALGAPGAARGLKKSLIEIARGKADPQQVQSRFLEGLVGGDLQEGLSAWRDKRPPRFAD